MQNAEAKPAHHGLTVITAVLLVTPVTTALVETAAAAASEVVQVTSEPERVEVLPSSKTPLAASCVVLPMPTEVVAGVTVMEVSVALVKKPWQPVSEMRSAKAMS